MSIFRFILRRLLLSLPVLLGVSVVVFTLVYLAPGDPVRVMLGPLSSEGLVRQVRLEMGFNRPLYVQCGLWMLDALQGDFGVSWTVQQGAPMTDIIVERTPLTVELSILSMVTAIFIAIPAGIISAVRKDKPAGHAARIAALPNVSIPDFQLGIILTMTFAVQFLFPWTTGGWTPPWVDPVANLQQLFLPVITLGTAYSTLIARVMHSKMLGALSQGYVKTARTMDVGVREVVLKDTSKNALILAVTVIGVDLGQLMSGAILVEAVFSLPGIGKLLMLAIDRRDYRIIQTLILFIASVFVFADLAMDVLYAYFDPRIRRDGN